MQKYFHCACLKFCFLQNQPIVKKIFLIIAFFFAVKEAASQHKIQLEVQGGTTINFRSPLKIERAGYETYTIHARYKTHSFKSPYYYVVYLGLWNKDKTAWGLRFTHQKIILQNPNESLTHFEISHGYNMLVLTRTWNNKWFMWHAGAGVVIAHPESIIDGVGFVGKGKGYYLSGVAAEAGIGKHFDITKWLYATTETKFSAGWARVPINGGHATAPNEAFHFAGGLGLRF